MTQVQPETNNAQKVGVIGTVKCWAKKATRDLPWNESKHAAQRICPYLITVWNQASGEEKAVHTA